MSDLKSFEQDFAQICSMEGPLKLRLDALTKIISIHDPEFADAYDELVRQLQAADAGGAAPQIGAVMPSFLLSDQNGHLVRLDEMLGKSPLIISFNRGHWCEYCDLELRAFAAAHAEYARSGARVVSIMPERLEYLRRVSARTNHALLTLSDMDNSYAMELGLVIWLGERVQKLLSASGLSLEKVQGNDSWFVPIPATFVLDSKGLIVARYVDPDFRTRMGVDEILTIVSSMNARNG
jgi:peroxiredoxin